MNLLRVLMVAGALALPASAALAEEEHPAAGEIHEAATEGAEHEGEHHEASIDPKRLAWQIANFAVLDFILV